MQLTFVKLEKLLHQRHKVMVDVAFRLTGTRDQSPGNEVLRLASHVLGQVEVSQRDQTCAVFDTTATATGVEKVQRDLVQQVHRVGSFKELAIDVSEESAVMHVIQYARHVTLELLPVANRMQNSRILQLALHTSVQATAEELTHWTHHRPVAQTHGVK